MFIYFITNNKKKNETKEVVSGIKQLGHEVVDETVGNKAQAGLPENVDMVIADLHEFSVDMNYRIILALSDRKPVLCLYPEKSNVAKNLPPAKGNVAKNLTVRSYTRSTLSVIIKEFLEILGEGSHAERFNFFLTPDLKEYINWIPYGKGTTKSGFIRQLIRDQMKKDNTYNTFLKKKK